ncbi:MAG: hypothetical protein ACFFD4_19755 [Candidatus Odinarchaeota archaeon]
MNYWRMTVKQLAILGAILLFLAILVIVFLASLFPDNQYSMFVLAVVDAFDKTGGVYGAIAVLLLLVGSYIYYEKKWKEKQKATKQEEGDTLVYDTYVDMYNLTEEDKVVFNACYEYLLRNKRNIFLQDNIRSEISTEITSEQFNESIEILDSRGLIDIDRSLASLIRTTAHGFEIYASQNIPDYDQKEKLIGQEIVRLERTDSKLLSELMNMDEYLVLQILKVFEYRNLIRIRERRTATDIYHVSAELKRTYRE